MPEYNRIYYNMRINLNVKSIVQNTLEIIDFIFLKPLTQDFYKSDIVVNKSVNEFFLFCYSID